MKSIYLNTDVLTFDQFNRMHQMAYNAISVIPHVSNGLAKPRAKSPDACFQTATHGISTGRTKEVHVDPVRGQTWTFDWVYAAPLKNPHF